MWTRGRLCPGPAVARAHTPRNLSCAEIYCCFFFFVAFPFCSAMATDRREIFMRVACAVLALICLFRQTDFDRYFYNEIVSKQIKITSLALDKCNTIEQVFRSFFSVLRSRLLLGTASITIHPIRSIKIVFLRRSSFPLLLLPPSPSSNGFLSCFALSRGNGKKKSNERSERSLDTGNTVNTTKVDSEKIQSFNASLICMGGV